MNTGVLAKCIEELKKEDFRKDYVLGMLETLVEISGSPLKDAYVLANGEGGVRVTNHERELARAQDDEATVLDAKARAALATVQSMAAESNDG